MKRELAVGDRVKTSIGTNGKIVVVRVDGLFQVILDDEQNYLFDRSELTRLIPRKKAAKERTWTAEEFISALHDVHADWDLTIRPSFLDALITRLKAGPR